MSIYITQQKKEELEAKIAELENTWNKSQQMWGKIFTLKEILSQAIVIPVEESWEDVEFSIDEPFGDLNRIYPNGVIIKP